MTSTDNEMDVTDANTVQPIPTLIGLKATIGMLRSRDAKMRQFAAATLVQAGRRILPHLVAHAADPDKSATHRIRLLKVIEQIGYPDAPGARGAIYRLTYDAPPLVRKAAVRLIRNCLFCTPPGNGRRG